MPTSPAKKVLNRELSLAGTKDIVDVACPLLREIVNYSTNSLLRCGEFAKSEKNVDLAPIILYQQLIELTDSIEVLISQSCAVGATPVLRSCFECSLSLEFILEDHYEQRALSWYYCYVLGLLKQAELHDSETTRGKNHKRLFTRELGQLPNLSDEDLSGIQKDIDNLKQVLKNEQLKPFDDEYKKRKKKKKPKNWYSFFDGPQNIRELAGLLMQETEYELSYKPWSALVHAATAKSYLTSTPNGTTGFFSMRNPEQSAEIANTSIRFLLLSTWRMLQHFHSQEMPQVNEWFKDEVVDRWERLGGDHEHKVHYLG